MIKIKDLIFVKKFIEIIIKILEKLKKPDDRYYYSKEQTVDIYDKREEVKLLSGTYDFETYFHNFTQNIITKSIMERFNFSDYHNLKKQFN